MQQQPAQGLPQQLHASQVRGTAQPVPVTGQPRPPGKGNLSCITLPPGFKLPPGKIIVKNEQGQIMIVNAGAGRGTTGLSKVIHEKHAATPRNMIIRSGSSSASGAAATGTPNQRHAAQLRYPTATSVRPVIRPSLQGMSTTQSVIQHAVKQKSPQTTPSSAPCVSTASSSAGIGELIQEPAKCVKQCKAFLSELIKLSVSRPQSTAHHVKSLIQGLIDGTVKPEEFMQKMQIVLKLSYQPQIVSILKKSLPPLRQSMLSNYTHIEGVRAPPASTVSRRIYAVRYCQQQHP